MWNKYLKNVEQVFEKMLALYRKYVDCVFDDCKYGI